VEEGQEGPSSSCLLALGCPSFKTQIDKLNRFKRPEIDCSPSYNTLGIS